MDCFKRYVNEKMMTLALTIYTRLFKNRMDRSDIRLPVELRMPSIQLLGVLFNGVLLPVISIVFFKPIKIASATELSRVARFFKLAP